MDIIQRENIIIYLKNMKHERHIRKYGHIVYTNSQQKYVSMYVNQKDIDDVVTRTDETEICHSRGRLTL